MILDALDSKTFRKVSIFSTALSVACAIGVLVGLHYSTVETSAAPPPVFVPASAPTKLSVRCRKLPTGVINWGIAMQSTPDGLYLCFQQGGGQGMTEVTCVPMEECSR